MHPEIPAPGLTLLRRKWVLICGACALPSFIFAIIGGFQGLPQLGAMLLGVFTFMIAFSVFESWPLHRKLFASPLMQKAQKAAIWMKLICSGIALLGIASLYARMEMLLLLALPEMWLGFFSINAISSLWSFAGLPDTGAASLPTGASLSHQHWDPNLFGYTYVTTLFHGLLKSAILFAFGWIAILWLKVTALDPAKQQ